MRKATLALLTVTLFLSGDLISEPIDPPQSSESVSVDYVLVPFIPLDRKGKPLSGLRETEVRLMVDGREVETDLFAHAASAPVSFTILLDGSGSMDLAGKMEGARAALETLIANRRTGDDYALFLSTSGGVQELVPFSTRGDAILSAFDMVEPFGKTAVFDAVMRMPDETVRGGNGSRAIILLTDGLDNASSIERPALLRQLEGIEVPVYPLGLVSRALLLPAAGASFESRLDLGVLGDLARMSGGRLAIANAPEDLQKEIELVLSELRSQYLIGFAPSGKGTVRYRRIEMEIDSRVSSVRVRTGYRGTDPPLAARGGRSTSR